MATDRKALILEAFKSRVSLLGFDKTTMLDVAREAGVSVGVIYKDFANKEELVDACLKQLYSQFIAHCQHLVDSELEPDVLLYHFIQELIGAINDQTNKGMQQFLKDEYILKHIKKNVSLKERAVEDLSRVVAGILKKGMDQGVFCPSDPQKTGKLFLMALLPNYVLPESERPGVTVPNFEEMYTFLVRALKR